MQPTDRANCDSSTTYATLTPLQHQYCPLAQQPAAHPPPHFIVHEKEVKKKREKGLLVVALKKK